MNKYGLNRNSLKTEQKEYIRKRDGFGCVHCGRGIYTYEHFNPPFKYAKSHDVNGITLLCGHCQLLSMKGVLSKETIAEDQKNPFCKKVGYQNDFLDLKTPCLIYFGKFEFYAVKGGKKCEILRFGEDLILGLFDDPINGPLQFTATFRDQNNKICLIIDKNEWKSSIYNWDVRHVGKRMTIFHDRKKIGIDMEVNPPNGIYFHKLITYYNSNKIELNEEELIIVNRKGEELKIKTLGIIRRSAPIIIDLDK